MSKGRSQAWKAVVLPVFHIVSHKFGGYCAANLANVKISGKKRLYYGCVPVILRFRGQEK
jgi:hypothetical protein